ncbi:MAG TPA: CPBP family intramembrane glutamic endopeptidase [Holophagaceae bacterium]|nr:CPBP family intramembrane glutamic endopeptidase [Holophagaceae bacterium]
MPPQTRARVATYLGLLLLFSCVFYVLILRAGSLRAGGGLYVLGIMWCPAAAALLTCLWRRKPLRELGWGLGSFRWQAWSYLLPFGYALVAYALIWAAGWGGFPNGEFLGKVAARFGWAGRPAAPVIAGYVGVMGTLGFLGSLLSALGEEIGWRGFLVPELMPSLGYTRTVLLTAAIWASWHFPILIGADYNNGTPAWFGLTCFTLLVLGVSFPLAWLRMRSGSLWTGAVLHASHNLFIQSVFTPLTAPRGRVTAYAIDEFGFVLPLVLLGVGFYFWKRRGELAPGASRA